MLIFINVVQKSGAGEKRQHTASLGERELFLLSKSDFLGGVSAITFFVCSSATFFVCPSMTFFVEWSTGYRDNLVPLKSTMGQILFTFIHDMIHKVKNYRPGDDGTLRSV